MRGTVVGTDPPRVVIVGPTASGKSGLAVSVAGRVGGEVLCVDSMTVYRGMDIGTAKPTHTEQRGVRHHLIDLVDPCDEMTVTQFASHARVTLDSLDQAGIPAVLVGGTGLYVDTVLNDLRPPGQWPELRHQFEAQARLEGTDGLYARLRELDPIAAARMEPTNTRRIVRAMEVCVGSGRPFSSYGPGLQASRDSVSEPTTPRAVMIGLRWSRVLLADRIQARFEEMLDLGFVAECAALKARYPSLSRTATQALGYRELWGYLNGESTLADAVATAVLRTRQFSVRQERWFRRDPRLVWVDLAPDTDFSAVEDTVVAAWEQLVH